MAPVEIPRLDRPDPGAGPRVVRFLEGGAQASRRGFLAVLGTAAMTLGLTVLGWIPLARLARADPGSEYPDCGRYSDGPGGPICYGAPYSPSYCGEDRWFKTGCYGKWDNGLDCYQPRLICKAGPEPRDGWRWKADGVEYRCSDGEIHYSGAPNLEQVICNATMDQDKAKPAWLGR
ncbi:MAG TPA: hypothetical protein VFO16_17875 [Pseudonocardiaceae bacterium]|nr:hypothetical protein [Pseudonocardiaceae bacterium]